MPVPLLSVVMPVYNPGNLFKYTLCSVLDQSFREFEVVISDDSDVELELHFVDKRIKYVKNPLNEKGIFSNLNHAIRYSKGKYIQIFCQDDIMKKNFLEEQVRVLQNNQEVAMVFSSYGTIEGLDQGSGDLNSNNSNHEIKTLAPGYFLNLLLIHGCIPGNLSPVMVRAEVFHQLGAFNEQFKFSGDFEYWVRIGKTWPVAYNPSKLLLVRKHSDQASVMLPSVELIRDLVRIYAELMHCHSVKLSNKYLSWYLNETVGVQLFFRLIKKILNTRHWAEWRGIRLLNEYPFSLAKILFLSLITFRNSVKIYKVNAGDLE